MSWLGNLFTNDNLIDSAVAGVDKLIFTQQEKADYLLRFLKAYEPFKIAQRLLALAFSSVFLFIFLIAVAMFLYGTAIMEEFFVLQAYELMKWNISTLGTAVSLIIGFYFAGGMLEGVVKARSEP